MDKTFKRQIAYKPAPKSNVMPAIKQKKQPISKVEVDQSSTRMGRKPKPKEDKVIIAHVWLTPKEISAIEEVHGSLTNAMKQLLFNIGVNGKVKELNNKNG